jgi:hypothetical protein
MTVKVPPEGVQRSAEEFGELDYIRAQALASFERARRKALDATGSLKGLPERVRAAVRADPSSLGDVLGGTIELPGAAGAAPDPLPSTLLAAAQEAFARVEVLSTAPRVATQESPAQTVRDSLVALAALPAWLPLSKWSLPMIERATILMYEWSDELQRVEGRENASLPRDNPMVSEARIAGATLLQEDKALAMSSPRLTDNHRAQILAKRHGLTVNAVRGRLRRARSPSR